MRWLDRAEIEDGYVGVPVIEAVEVVVNELRRLQAEVADWQEAAGRSRSDVMAYIAERAKLLEEHDVALAEVGALKAELQSQRERNTELIFKLGSATNGWGRCEKERDAALAEVELLRQFERICEGLPQDAIDGGWTVQGIRGYAKRLEDQLKTALGQHNVPSGWKLVPLEPTPEMLDARRDGGTEWTAISLRIPSTTSRIGVRFATSWHVSIADSLPQPQRLEVSDDHAQGSGRHRTRRAVWPGHCCRRRRTPAVQDPVHLGGMPVMRGSDIPPPPGYRPTPLATLGQQLVRLGQAMQNPNTKLGELTELVQACGVDLRICDTNKESRS